MATLTMPSRLDIDVERTADGATVVRLAGELKVRTAAAARRAVGDVVDGDGTPSITIDLAEVSAIDTAGLAAITAPAVRCLRRPVSLTIVPPRRPDVSRLVDRVGVITILNRSRP
jgi:anti-anti-sigma factor